MVFVAASFRGTLGFLEECGRVKGNRAPTLLLWSERTGRHWDKECCVGISSVAFLIRLRNLPAAIREEVWPVTGMPRPRPTGCELLMTQDLDSKTQVLMAWSGPPSGSFIVIIGTLTGSFSKNHTWEVILAVCGVSYPQLIGKPLWSQFLKTVVCTQMCVLAVPVHCLWVSYSSGNTNKLWMEFGVLVVSSAFKNHEWK